VVNSVWEFGEIVPFMPLVTVADRDLLALVLERPSNRDGE
jgi:hypothetical protein